MLEFRQPFTGDYKISLDFHEKWLPTYDNVKTFHQGIDYLCPVNTPILASEDGSVIRSGFASTGYGEYIILQHEDGSGTVYAHLSTRIKHLFDSVKKGDVIGYSGNTGNSSGPHLHFEYRKKASDYNSAEDPKTVLHSVFDKDPDIYTPSPVKPQFATLREGLCIVCADTVNVRCHCDMSLIIGQRHKGDIISIGDEVTEYMGLPFRDYYDARYKCWLRIAEHDPDTQLLENYDLPDLNVYAVPQ